MMPRSDPSAPLRRYLGVQSAAEKEVNRILQDSMRDLDKQLENLRTRGGIGAAIRRTQLQAARLSILGVIAAIWRRLGLLIQERTVDAAIAATAVAAQWDSEFLDRLGLDATQRRAWQRRLEEAAKRSARLGINRRFDTAGGTNRELSTRVYGSQNLANRLVQRKIESALTRGLSAKELADEIRDMIRPDVPGGISYAAKRLARTELNNAFHYQQIQDALEKPWVSGLRWRISGSHPTPDICDKIAAAHSEGKEPGVYNKDEVPDKPHPQCLCSLIPVTQDPEDFMQGLLAELPPAPKPNPPTPSAPVSSARIPERKPGTTSKNREVMQSRKSNLTAVKAAWAAFSNSEKQRARKAIRERAAGKVNIRIREKNLKAVLRDGRMKNAYEVVKDDDYMQARRSYEEDIMGVRERAEKDRPIYGYFGEPEDMDSYGEYAITLKSGVRDRITASVGDSLNGMLDVHNPDKLAGLSDDDLLKAMGRYELPNLGDGEFGQYMEAQIHGGVSLDDIDYLTVPSDAPQELLDELTAKGIRFVVELSEDDRFMAELKRKLGIE